MGENIMKNIAVFLLAVLCVIAAGCTPMPGSPGQPSVQTGEQVTCDDGRVVSNKDLCLQARGGDSVPENKEGPQAELDPVVAKLIDSARARAKSLQYHMRFEAASSEIGDFYEMTADDNKIRITLNNPLRKPSGIYDVIYVDRAARTAVGICEELDDYTCSGNEIEAIDVYYNEYADIKTPYDWLDEMDNGKFSKDTTYENKNTKLVSFVAKNGKVYNLWLDAYYGVPIRVESEDRSDVIFYKNIAYNGVSASDVVGPVAKG